MREIRREFVERHQTGLYSVTELCTQYGVSRQTAYKWLRRFRDEGYAGFCDRRRRLHGSPRKTPERLERAILELRDAHPTWGASRHDRRPELCAGHVYRKGICMRTCCVTLTLAAALVLALARTALTQDDWPQPKEGWWQTLKAGTTATFESRRAPDTLMKLVITVDAVEGSQVTYSTQIWRGDTARPKQTETVDVEAVGGGLPDGAKVKKGASSTVDVAGTSFKVTEYEVEFQGTRMEVWHSPELEPIFAGGHVKMITDTETIVLIDYKKGR